jgi:hypothetical protein
MKDRGLFALSLLSACVSGFSPHPSVRRDFQSASRLDAATSLPLESYSSPVPESLVDAAAPQVGVLLLNLGGPETSEDVEGA